MHTENGGMEARFNTASYEEIKGAEVTDVYFRRTMEVLKARGIENTPVFAEVTLKTSDPDAWFVVAGLDEVAHLLEDVDVEAHAVPEGTICRPYEPVLTLSGPYAAFAEYETAILGFLCQASGVATGAGAVQDRRRGPATDLLRGTPDAPIHHAHDRTGRLPGRM